MRNITSVFLRNLWASASVTSSNSVRAIQCWRIISTLLDLPYWTKYTPTQQIRSPRTEEEQHTNWHLKRFCKVIFFGIVGIDEH
jgi:hypothetical protein